MPKKVLLDEPCNILHESYVLSCKVSNLVASQAPIDIYIRLRGFENDSPLILFRDFENRMKEDLKLNLIFSIENDIGAVLQIDFVMDVPDMEDDIMVASLTEVELRNAMRVSEDQVARGAIDQNIFISNRGTAARIDMEYENQEKSFSNFYLPIAIRNRDIWGHFSPTIAARALRKHFNYF